MALGKKTVACSLVYGGSRQRGLTQDGRSHQNLALPHCFSHQRSTQEVHLVAWPKPHRRMWMGPSLKRKGPDRGTLLFQAPNSGPSLLSMFILAPAVYSYLKIAFFTASMSERQDTKTVMSSAYAKTFACLLSIKITLVWFPMIHLIEGLGLI